MTALEYMQQQLSKHTTNYERALLRGATKTELQNIQDKIEHYSKAVDALKERSSKV
jgi:hypothetical protein